MSGARRVISSSKADIAVYCVVGILRHYETLQFVDIIILFVQFRFPLIPVPPWCIYRARTFACISNHRLSTAPCVPGSAIAARHPHSLTDPQDEEISTLLCFSCLSHCDNVVSFFCPGSRRRMREAGRRRDMSLERLLLAMGFLRYHVCKCTVSPHVPFHRMLLTRHQGIL